MATGGAFGFAAGTDVPLEHLDYGYISECTSAKEVEKLLKILRSGREGVYPDLIKFTEDRLCLLDPTNRLLLPSNKKTTAYDLPRDEQLELENDLEAWSQCIGVEERALTEEATGQHNGQREREILKSLGLPPIRKAAVVGDTVQPTPNQPRQSLETNVSSQRIKSSDFRGWERFDAEAVAARVDREEEREGEEREKTNNDSWKTSLRAELSESEKDMTGIEREKLAVHEKEKGNESFKSGDLEEAVVYYSRSISLTPSTAAYNNRALMYIKLGQPSEAVADCAKVLEKEHDNMKALFRLATARTELKQETEAVAVYERILQFDPANKKAQDQLRALRSRSKLRCSAGEEVLRKNRLHIVEVEGCGGEREKREGERERARDKRVMQGLYEKLRAKKRTETEKRAVPDSESDAKMGGSARERGAAGEPEGARIDEGVKEGQKVGVSKGGGKPKDVNGFGKSSTKPEKPLTEQIVSSPSSTPAKASPPPAQATPSPVQATPPPLPPAVQKLKDEGKKLFQSGQYSEALVKYNLAIRQLEKGDNDHTQALSTLFSNRAACFLKTGECGRCVKDCSTSISLHPLNPKALLRRALAYEQMEKYQEAYMDFHLCLRLGSTLQQTLQATTRLSRHLQDLHGLNWRVNLPSHPDADSVLDALRAQSIVTPVNAVQTQLMPADAVQTRLMPADAVQTRLMPADAVQTRLTPADAVQTQLTPADDGEMRVTPDDDDIAGETQLTPDDDGKTQLTPDDAGETQLTSEDVVETQLTPADDGETQLTPDDAGETQLTPEDVVETQLTPADAGEAQLTPDDVVETQLTPDDAKETQLTPADVVETQLIPDDDGKTQLTPDDAKETQLTPADAGEAQLIPDDDGKTQLTPDDAKETQLTPADAGEAQLIPDDDGKTQLTPDDAGETQLTPGDVVEAQLTPDDAGEAQVDAGEMQVTEDESVLTHVTPGDAGETQLKPDETPATSDEHVQTPATPRDDTETPVAHDETPQTSYEHKQAPPTSGECNETPPTSDECNETPTSDERNETPPTPSGDTQTPVTCEGSSTTPVTTEDDSLTPLDTNSTQDASTVTQMTRPDAVNDTAKVQVTQSDAAVTQDDSKETQETPANVVVTQNNSKETPADAAVTRDDTKETQETPADVAVTRDDTKETQETPANAAVTRDDSKETQETPADAAVTRDDTKETQETPVDAVVTRDDTKETQETPADAAQTLGDTTPVTPDDTESSERLYNEYKSKGNRHVKKDEFTQAVKWYSKCVDIFPDRAPAYNNRAFCYLKMKDAKAAERDCSCALKLEPDNIKALYRRGVARKELGNYREAMKDLRKLMKQDPNNAAGGKELGIVKQLWEKELRTLQTKPSQSSTKETKTDQKSGTRKPTSPFSTRGPTSTRGQVNTVGQATTRISTSRTKASGKSPSNKSRGPGKSSEAVGATKGATASKSRGKNSAERVTPLTNTRKSAVDRLLVVGEDEEREGEGEREGVHQRLTRLLTADKTTYFTSTDDYQPLKRTKIKIVEVEHSSDEEEEEEGGATEGRKSSEDPEEKEGQRESENVDSLGVVVEGEVSDGGDRCEGVSRVREEEEEEEENEERGEEGDGGEGERERDEVEESAKVVVVESKEGEETATPDKDDKKSEVAVRETPGDDGSHHDSPPLPVLNLTSYEFVQRWNSIPRSARSEDYAKLLQLIPLDQLPDIITNKLDGTMLTHILEAINEHFIPRGKYKLTAELLYNLSRVQRFSMVSMFLSRSEKQGLSKVLEVLTSQEAVELTPDMLGTIKTSYGI